MEVGRESESHSSPAACVPSFQAECCCLLALQERVQKIILWRCVSFVCALFSSDVCPIHKKGEKKKF